MGAILETTITAPPAGAGRTLDMTYPAPDFRTVGVNVDPPGLALSRQGILTNAGWLNVLGAGANPVPRGPTVYGGRVAWKMTADGASASVVYLGAGLNFYTNTTIGGANAQGDFSCWRVLAILACTPGGAGDLGLEVTLDNAAGNMISATTRGFCLRPDGPAQINFKARQTAAAPLTIDDVMPAVVDVTEYNAYEFRLISATSTNEAFCRVLINGQQQAVYPFDGVTMPDGGVWTVCLCNRGAAALYVPMDGLRVSAAASELALL